MKEFTLKKKEPDYWKLNIEGDSFLIPLAKSITLEEAELLKTQNGVIDFFRKYLGDEVCNKLSVEHFEVLSKAWAEASAETAKSGGASVGES